MRSPSVAALLAVFAAATLTHEAAAQGLGGRGGGRGNATAIQPGEECPPGTTEIRPRSCMAPEVPAPSILDYRPQSTLVAPAHMVPKAKYPAIDFHGHPQGLLGSAEGLDDARRGARQPQRPDDGRRPTTCRASGSRRRSRTINGVADDEGPRPRARRHQLPERRAGLGGEGGRAARGGRRGGRGRRRRDRQRASACRSKKPDGSRLKHRRSRARSDLGRVRAAQASGVHPHRRSAGVLPADRLHERALARAGAVPATAAIRRTGSRASRS